MDSKYRIRKDPDRGWALYLRMPRVGSMPGGYARITPWLSSQQAAIRIMDYRERTYRNR